MQAMNFNFDSTYIPNTIQQSQNSQTMDFFSGAEQTVSFMQMVQSAQEKITEPNVDNQVESVSTNHKEVIKSSTQTAEKESVKSEENADFEKNVAVKNTDVSKEEQSSEKEEVAKKSVNAQILALNISNPADKKNQINDSDGKVAAAKKALNSFKISTEKNSSREKISLLKEKVDEEKLSLIVDKNKNIKLEKKDGKDESEVLANLLSSQESNKNKNDFTNVLQQKENSTIAAKDLKNKKVEKKLSDVISVTDLRVKKQEELTTTKKTELTTSIKQTSNNSATVTLDLNNQAQKNILSLDSQTAGAQGSNFQAMLENQIFENSADFVKAGKIVLKDNDVGNIDLILHPQSLGNVKISLELSDKVINGKILVSSQEALEAFNATQESLKAAFIESGFDGASFDVSFANQNAQFASQGQSQSQQDNSRDAQKSYGNYVVENSSVEENNSDIYNDERDFSLNIVA